MPMALPAAQAFVLAQINTFFGPPPAGVDPAPIVAQRMALANSIASLVTYIQTNADVKSGITVSTPAGPGVTNAPGQIE
jgi:hypothetical protein